MVVSLFLFGLFLVVCRILHYVIYFLLNVFDLFLKGKLDSWVSSVRKAKKSGKKHSVYYTLIGCPHIFQVWFYESCKYLSGLYCKKVTSGIPRVVQWTCSSQPSFKLLKTSVFDVSNEKVSYLVFLMFCCSCYLVAFYIYNVDF